MTVATDGEADTCGDREPVIAVQPAKLHANRMTTGDRSLPIIGNLIGEMLVYAEHLVLPEVEAHFPWEPANFMPKSRIPANNTNT